MSGSISARRDRVPRRRAYWPVTGALKTWLAFGDTPSLTRPLEAGRRRTMPPWSGAASYGPIRGVRSRLRRSSRMFAPTWPTRRSRCARRYADAYKVGRAAGLSPVAAHGRTEWDRAGWVARRCGRFRVRCSQTGSSLLPNLSSVDRAIKESTLRRDGNGNPAIDRARSRGTY